ncbi:Ficolin-1-A [Bulinus truncatus]|nr:Ficolin-1-A [Bulinus truncatus]
MTIYLRAVNLLIALLTIFKQEPSTALISEEVSEKNCPPAQVALCVRGMKSQRNYVHIYNGELGVSYLCDTKTNGGGWIVIQRRVHRSFNFTYDWHLFKHGFGPVCDDYWLGNKYIHQITSSGNYELWIDMEYKSIEYYARYNNFSIDNEMEKYTLHVSNFTGNVQDEFGKHNGFKFSTWDKDHTNICAKRYLTGWWYQSCHSVSLNGYFGDGRWWYGVIWQSLTGARDSLTSVEMKIRQR